MWERALRAGDPRRGGVIGGLVGAVAGERARRLRCVRVPSANSQRFGHSVASRARDHRWERPVGVRPGHPVQLPMYPRQDRATSYIVLISRLDEPMGIRRREQMKE